MRNPVGQAVEIGKGEPLVARNKRLVGGVQRTECAEELRKRCREVVDDRAAQLVLADDEPPAGADDPRQFLVKAAVELARHAPS